MSNPKNNPTATVTVDRAALRALKAELAQERETARQLQRDLTREGETARKAAEELLTARAETEGFRRVLAASVANEKRSEEETSRIRSEVERHEELLLAAERARGEADGRAQELRREVSEARVEFERQAALADEIARGGAEETAREVHRLQNELGSAQGQLREILRRTPSEIPPSVRAAAQRARFCQAGALVSAGLCLVFFLPFVTALLSDEAITWPHMASGLSGWNLFWLEALFFGSALGFWAWAIQDLRGVEKIRRARLEADTSKAGVDGARSPSAG